MPLSNSDASLRAGKIIKRALKRFKMFTYINFKSRILFGFLAVISLTNLSNTARDLIEINDTLLPNALLMGQMARDIVLVNHKN